MCRITTLPVSPHNRYFPMIMIEKNNPRQRSAIREGLVVGIIQKSDQRSGKIIQGTVQEILTNSSFHPHGIKVRLTDGCVGRVAKIIGDEPERSGSDSA